MARSLQRTISDKDWAYLRSPSHKHVPLRERLMQVLQVSTEDTLPNRIRAPSPCVSSKVTSWAVVREMALPMCNPRFLV